MENKLVQCPRCKSENIVSTVTYRKTPVIRVFKFICIMAALITIIYNIYDFIAHSTPNASQSIMASTGNKNNIILAGIFIGMSIIFEIMQQYHESKGCILYFCKDCDHTWKIGND